MTSDPQLVSSDVPAAAPAKKSWLGFALGLIAFVVVLAVALAVLGDWLARNAEATRLVDRIEASEATMIAFQADVDTAIASVGDLSAATPEQADAFNAELQAIAADNLPALADAGAAVASTPILPWHPELADARDAYADHNLAWQEYLTALTEDPAVFAEPQERINDSFLLAEEVLRPAIPSPALFDLQDRLEVIFAPPPVDTSGPTQQV